MVNCTDSYHSAIIQGHRKFLAACNYCQTYKEGLTDNCFLDHIRRGIYNILSLCISWSLYRYITMWKITCNTSQMRFVDCLGTKAR